MAAIDATAETVDEAWVRDRFERFNDSDSFFADVEGTWIDRPHYRVVAQDLEMSTRGEVVAWFSVLFDAIPDLRMTIEEVVVAGASGRERVTVRWSIAGTFSGGPFVGVEPTGRPVVLHGMDLLDIEDGRVAGNVIYYDQLAFARQIGMLPAEGSPGDRLMTGAFNLMTRVRARVGFTPSG